VLDSLCAETFASGPPSNPAAKPFSQSDPSGTPNPAPPSASEPGELTRMYQAMPFAAAPSPTEPPKPFSGSASDFSLSQPKKQPAGDFTKVFSQLPTPRSAPPRPAPPPPVRVPEQPSAPPSSGEFTQMFQSLSSSREAEGVTTPPEPVRSADTITIPVATAPSSASTEPQKEAGSFTQLFQAVSSNAPSPEKPTPARQPQDVPATPPAPETEPGSFTSLFQAVQNRPQPEPLHPSPLSERPRSVPQTDFMVPRPAKDSVANQGGFTRLFDTLSDDKRKDGPFSNPSPNATFQQPIRESAPPQPPPMQSGPGEFTRLLQTLADPSGPQDLPAAQAGPGFPATPPPTTPPPQQSGPGEFTRVISNAAFREAQNQSGKGTSPSVPPSQPSFPAVPQKPAFPAYPAPSAQPPRPAMPSTPAFQVPTPPAFPAPQPPAPAPPPASKLQQYLPLLVVVNIFVLLIVVLIVIFVLRRH
jgi:hypothetical protein